MQNIQPNVSPCSKVRKHQGTGSETEKKKEEKERCKGRTDKRKIRKERKKRLVPS